MPQFIRRLQYLFHRRRFDQELANDLAFHRKMAAREAGLPLGNALLLREQSRDAWGWTCIDRLGQDLRYGARLLRKSPAFTAVALLMLALAIGVNVAAFGFFNLMVLHPLPVRDPQTLLRFSRVSPENFADNFPYPEVAFYAEHCRSLSAVMALSFGKLAIGQDEQSLNVTFVTPSFFTELGAAPALGRMLDAGQDASPGANAVVVLDHAFWQRHFAGDPSVVGRTIHLNGRPSTVIGVAANRFSGLGLDRPDLWAPLNQQPYFLHGAQSLTDFSERGINVQMVARLRAGVSPSASQTELASLAAELHRLHPNDVWEKETLSGEPAGFAVAVRHEMYPVLGLAAAMGLLILVAACGNLGSLLLARGVARRQEISIRTAVGAGRGRLVRQLITESLLLAALGLAAGLAFGYVALRALLAWSGLPSWIDPTPDWRVMLFAFGLASAALLLFGLMPSFNVARNVARQRYRANRLRQFLIAAQVAASCVLLIVAALLGRALNHAAHYAPGFDYEHVITVDPAFRGYTPERARTYLASLDQRLRGIPGVDSIALATNPPLGNRWTVVKADIAGRAVNVHFNNVDPPFFRTMRIPLLRGRNLTPDQPDAVLISESLARLQWPAEDPIGKVLRIGNDRLTVAGVTGAARLVSPEDSDAVEVYRLVHLDVLPSIVLMVRAAGSPEGLLRPVTAAAKSIDPVLLPDVRLMKTAFRGKLQIAGYTAATVTLLGAIALLLACAGIVGLVAYAVTERTREIGIRMALGARPAHVLATVLRQLSIPLLTGLLAGAAAAATLSRILRMMLYGVSNFDPLAYLGAMLLFALAVVMAALLPARRALRVDPIRALRYE